MGFCPRHTDALLLAVGARGIPEMVAFDPVEFARQAIVDHATNFAGRAAVDMLTRGYCPMCFVNRAIKNDRKNPGLTVDGWVDNAAEAAAQEQVRIQDQPDPPARLVN